MRSCEERGTHARPLFSLSASLGAPIAPDRSNQPLDPTQRACLCRLRMQRHTQVASSRCINGHAYYVRTYPSLCSRPIGHRPAAAGRGGETETTGRIAAQSGRGPGRTPPPPSRALFQSRTVSRCLPLPAAVRARRQAAGRGTEVSLLALGVC
jgi:hypothetical protein